MKKTTKEIKKDKKFWADPDVLLPCSPCREVKQPASGRELHSCEKFHQKRPLPRNRQGPFLFMMSERSVSSFEL